MSELPITYPDKVLDEESGLTKRMLAEYYLAVSDHMLPHVAEELNPGDFLQFRIVRPSAALSMRGGGAGGEEIHKNPYWQTSFQHQLQQLRAMGMRSNLTG